MKTIKYFCKLEPNDSLEVIDDGDYLGLNMEGNSVVLNVVQVDKLRQQLHDWLHERASEPDGENWEEAE